MKLSMRMGLAIFFWLLMSHWAQGQQLTIKVAGIPSAKGNVLLAIFNDAVGFPDDSKKAYKLDQVPAQKGAVEVKLSNVPAGTYAIAVFHDANGDGKLNTNALGIPKEAYGFSNDARPTFRAPNFQEAGFAFRQSATVIIQVK